MTSGIYAIVNSTNDKCYVGSAKNIKRRWGQHLRALRDQKHWNIKLQRSFNKYGETSFSICTLEEAVYDADIVALENLWMEMLDSKTNGYNIADASFGDTISHHPNREDIIKRRTATSRAALDAMTPGERSTKFGRAGDKNPMYGVKRPQYVHDAMRAGTAMYVLKHGHGPNKGWKMGDVQKQALSVLASERTGNKNSFYGKSHNKEARELQRRARLGKKPSNCRSISVDGVVYSSICEASSATGVKVTTLLHRANSVNPRFSTTFFMSA